MIELNKIYNIDCMDGLKSIEDESIDLIVTSPPYNKSLFNKERPMYRRSSWKNTISYDTYSDDMPMEEYFKWQIDFLNECYRVLKPSGSLFYNHKMWRHEHKSIFPKYIFDSMLDLYQIIYWDRMGAVNVNTEFLYPTTEFIFWMTKGKPKVYKSNLSNEFRGEIWRIQPSNSKLHPASFPKQIPFNCINLTTDINDIVLDPFSGSGTTSICAKELGRNYLGFEISENYCNISNSLLKELEIKSDLFS